MQPVWDEYSRRGAAGSTPSPPSTTSSPARPSGTTPNPLLDGIEPVPVVLAVAADLRRIALMDGDLDRPPLTGGASIYPFCWSILLAARDHGLGGVMTTFLSPRRARRRARARPARRPRARGHHLPRLPERSATKLRRNPVETFATVDRFDGRPAHVVTRRPVRLHRPVSADRRGPPGPDLTTEPEGHRLAQAAGTGRLMLQRRWLLVAVFDCVTVPPAPGLRTNTGA